MHGSHRLHQQVQGVVEAGENNTKKTVETKIIEILYDALLK